MVLLFMVVSNTYSGQMFMISFVFPSKVMTFKNARFQPSI